MDTMISIEDLTKTFATKGEEVTAFADVNLEVPEGEFLVLLGPSGSGKTTLLRCVAGLERPDSGEIFLGGRRVFSGAGKVFVRPEERQLGMVFQSYAIWPHMTVFDNVALPLKRGLAKIPKDQVEGRVLHALSQVGMESMAYRPAPQLSGGQQQRVALARSLALEPKVLLMDEPLSNLDARLREEVRAEVRDVVRRVGLTVLYVTHDQAEAMDLADRIVVLHQGRVLQVGSAEDLYNRPTSREVAQFLGSMNWINGTTGHGSAVRTALGEIQVGPTELGGGLDAGTPVTLGVRPECVRLMAERGTHQGGDIVLAGTIVNGTFLGDHTLYRLQVGKSLITAKVALSAPLTGDVFVSIPQDRLCLFPGQWEALAGATPPGED
jgi:iron(III) transport system ATP-binding protein